MNFRGFVLAALALSAACAAPPAETTRAARQSGREALRAGAETYAPGEYRAYRYAMERARYFQMEEDTRLLPLFRDYSRTLRAFATAKVRGDQARASALQEQTQVSARARRQWSQADQALAGVRTLVAGIPVGRVSRSILAQADLLIAESHQFLRIEEYAKARAAALRALDKIAQVENRVRYVLQRYRRPDLLRKWRNWVQATAGWSDQNISFAVVVDKSRHTCTLFFDGEVFNRYAVNLGVNGLSQKFRQGDSATPEGEYLVVEKLEPDESGLYKGLMLDYPNEADRERFEWAKQKRIISSRSTIGGRIMLHGEGRADADWTQGCVALRNEDMDEIFEWVGVGTPVTIVGRDTSRFAASVPNSRDVLARSRRD